MHSKKFNPVSLIRKKREGESLSNEEITFLIQQYTAGALPDYQMSAFLMAAFINYLNDEEAAALTESMLQSGDIVDLSDIPGKKVDKHSTGGVGDKLSLILAPIVASYGVPVPMISGRGLGHTGGTLDKLVSIPGFTVDISLKRYRRILKKHNMVMAGQTEEIAPADKKLYALRDVTATVESISLIASSIMSKKLAEGIDALVLDVKFGAGAFMKNQEEALDLAKILVEIGEKFGKETIAYLSCMEQPLGYKIGNWLEVEESIDALQGNGPDDVMDVTHQLAGTMIYLGDEADSIEGGIEKSKKAVANGQAWKKLLELVDEQGGDITLLEQPDDYKQADHQKEIISSRDGYIQAMDAYKIGMASLELGAGRKTKEDKVDPAAGIILRKKRGEAVKKGETIARCFTNNSQTLKTAEELMEDAVIIEEQQPAVEKMVTHRVEISGVQLL